MSIFGVGFFSLMFYTKTTLLCRQLNWYCYPHTNLVCFSRKQVEDLIRCHETGKSVLNKNNKQQREGVRGCCVKGGMP